MNYSLRPLNLIAALIAVTAGFATLLGYFVQLDALLVLRIGLISLASLLAAWAVLAGALNLLIVHTRKAFSQSAGWLYSFFVLLGFFVVFVANLVSPLVGWGSGAGSQTNTWLLTHLISAGGASLAGLIAFFLVFAGYRLLRRRPTPMMVIFVVTVVLTLLVIAPWPAGAPNPSVGIGATARDALRTLTQVPAIGGARGLLLGIALGVVATGLRVLLGFDRPYGD